MNALPQLKAPPSYILLENVKGFEESESCALALTRLKEAGYSYQQFLLTPNQFGIPNSRLRYYLLARRGGAEFAAEQAILTHIPGNPHFKGEGKEEAGERLPRPMSEYLELRAEEVEDGSFESFMVPPELVQA